METRERAEDCATPVLLLFIQTVKQTIKQKWKQFKIVQEETEQNQRVQDYDASNKDAVNYTRKENTISYIVQRMLEVPSGIVIMIFLPLQYCLSPLRNTRFLSSLIIVV